MSDITSRPLRFGSAAANDMSGLAEAQDGDTFDLSRQVVKMGPSARVGTATEATDFQNGPLQLVTLNTPITTWTTTNREPGATVEVIINPSGAHRRIVPNASWNWIGREPSLVKSGTMGILKLRCLSDSEAGIYASWREEGEPAWDEMYRDKVQASALASPLSSPEIWDPPVRMLYRSAGHWRCGGSTTGPSSDGNFGWADDGVWPWNILGSPQNHQTGSGIVPWPGIYRGQNEGCYIPRGHFIFGGHMRFTLVGRVYSPLGGTGVGVSVYVEPRTRADYFDSDNPISAANIAFGADTTSFAFGAGGSLGAANMLGIFFKVVVDGYAFEDAVQAWEAKATVIKNNGTSYIEYDADSVQTFDFQADDAVMRCGMKVMDGLNAQHADYYVDVLQYRVELWSEQD